MSTDPNATGTTDQPAGDAVVEPQTTGATEPAGGTAQDTPATADELTSLREENQRLKSAHEQSLGEKTTFEETRRRLQDLESRVGQSATSGTDQAEALQLYNQGMASLWERARNKEPEAIAILGQMQLSNAEVQRLNRELAKYSVPENVRDQAAKLQSELAAQGEQISIATAKRLVEAESLTKRAAAIDAAEKAAAAAADARKRGSTGTRTVGSGAANPQTGQRQEMTVADWHTKYNSADDAKQQEMYEQKRKGLIRVID